MSQNKNDFRRLKENADIRAVIEYCGIRRGRRVGTANFVQCPNPKHDDKHPTNAYYRDGWNTIYCTTCHKNMNPIDIIMWTRGISYGEAADALWELEGRPDWYYADRTQEKEEVFSISLSELEFLGIKIPSTIYLPVRYTKAREMAAERLKHGCIYQHTGHGYLLVCPQRLDWTDLLSRKAIRKLVISRCERMEQEFKDIERRLGYSKLFEKQHEKIQELKNRASDRRLK